jgi:tetratricopeptide (TPR) repeat protein
MSAKRRLKSVFLAFALCAFLPSASPAAAQDDSPTRDAAKHFQRGVTLYSEADYHAALVEFQRAYARAPNVAVLYNVAEAEYQLQEYASALAAFERYVGQTSAADPRRGEVESTLEVLRTRVGHLSLTTDPRGADVTVDDELVGTTPLDQAIAVSVGHRKVTVSITGRQPVTRYVDVAAEDTVSLSLQVPPPASGISLPESASGRPAHTSEPAGTLRNNSTLRVLGWTTTGAWAAGAVSFGILALSSSSALARARETYPTTSATLDRDANNTKTYSMVADCLTAAAVAVGGITLISTLSSSPSARREPATARVWLGPTSAHFEMTF